MANQGASSFTGAGPLSARTDSRSLDSAECPGEDFPRNQAESEEDKPHTRFYFPDDFVVLKVETTLFRVPKFILNKHSAKCRQLLDTGLSTHEAKMHLFGIRVVDFERFLSVLLPTDVGQYDVSSVEEWTSVLDVAHKWECPSVRKLAIDRIAPLASAVDKVMLGHEYDVPEWVSDGYIDLCQRESCISDQEGVRLGVEDVLHISNIRFHLLAMQTGARVQGGSLPHLFSGPKRHLLGTNRVTDFIEKAKASQNCDSAFLAPEGPLSQPSGSLKFEEYNLDIFLTTMSPPPPDVPYTTTVRSRLEAQGLTTVKVPELYESISSMPSYEGYSFEELRLHDYIRGRKVASPQPASEGTSALEALLSASPQPSGSVFAVQPPPRYTFGVAHLPTPPRHFG